jgi:hypothetical protein
MKLRIRWLAALLVLIAPANKASEGGKSVDFYVTIATHNFTNAKTMKALQTSALSSLIIEANGLKSGSRESIWPRLKGGWDDIG